jgi:hypothetical protein
MPQKRMLGFASKFLILEHAARTFDHRCRARHDLQFALLA